MTAHKLQIGGFSLRSRKRVLKKINNWKGNPMLVAGMYRLFTYVAWEDIPEEYKQHFDKNAEATWNDDLDSFGKRNIKLDVDAEIKAILQLVVKRNITHSLGLIPIVLADVYVLGIGVSTFQGSLIKIINSYEKHLVVDRELAEQLTILDTIDLLKSVIKKTRIKLSYDIDDVAQTLLTQYEKVGKKNNKAKNKKVDIEAAVNLALSKEKEAKGEF